MWSRFPLPNLFSVRAGGSNFPGNLKYLFPDNGQSLYQRGASIYQICQIHSVNLVTSSCEKKSLDLCYELRHLLPFPSSLIIAMHSLLNWLKLAISLFYNIVLFCGIFLIRHFEPLAFSHWMIKTEVHKLVTKNGPIFGPSKFALIP